MSQNKPQNQAMRFVYATCNNCGEITACVDIENEQKSPDCYKWDSTEDGGFPFITEPCCHPNHANPCIHLHFSATDPRINPKEHPEGRYCPACQMTLMLVNYEDDGREVYCCPRCAHHQTYSPSEEST